MGKVRAASVVWGILSILFGWSVFAYWWLLVLGRSEPRTVLMTIAAAVLIANVLLAASMLWIVHNRRLARNGCRGNATPFSVPQFTRDRIDRVLVLPEHELLQTALIILVSVTMDEKSYVPVTSIS